MAVNLDNHAEWELKVKLGWSAAERGDFEEAKKQYQLADDMEFYGRLNPELSILRHTLGSATGIVEPGQMTEDLVMALVMPATSVQSMNPNLREPVIDSEKLELSISDLVTHLNMGMFKENITKSLPHVLVVSAGRSGTVSLYRLFQQSNFVPYHNYFFGVEETQQIEVMCRFLDGYFNGIEPILGLWLKTRAAEWLGPISQDRPMMGLNHLDTLFAPVFANLHESSKFVYLHRNPIKIFESFYGKSQWNPHQMSPVYYDFTPEFEWRHMGLDLPVRLAWYIYFVEKFSRALGKVLGDSFIEISSEKLFQQDEGEVKKLLDFTGADIPLDAAVRHFTRPYNQKIHKADTPPSQMAMAREVFDKIYARLLNTGML